MSENLFTAPLYDVCNDAANYFFEQLRSDAGKPALNYIKERGLTNAYLDAYAIGYAPKDGSGLIKALSKAHSAAIINDAGLGYNGKDFFRDRLIFPIFNENNDIIAFTGRKLSDNPDEPKYINTRETTIYKKSNVLYGFNIAKQHIPGEKYTIIVEGNTDLIALHQNHIYNSVASCGTAFSEDQLAKLLTITSHFILVYDSDYAGLKASIRIAERFIPQGIKFGLVELPEGEDPASFILSQSRYDFMKLVLKRVSFVQFIVNAYKRKGRFNDPDQKSVCTDEILNLIALSREQEATSYFVNQLSELVSIPVEMLRKDLYKRKGR